MKQCVTDQRSETKMRYFAYGSNMSIRRLQARTPSARHLDTGWLEGHRLEFHKIGRIDGSAKCDALKTGNSAHRVHGVLFELATEDKPALDRAEGLGMGYALKEVVVRRRGGPGVKAFTYYATLTSAHLRPFDWYKEHVLRGARENDLPEAYIRHIEAIEADEDPETARRMRELSIYIGD